MKALQPRLQILMTHLKQNSNRMATTNGVAVFSQIFGKRLWIQRFDDVHSLLKKEHIGKFNYVLTIEIKKTPAECLILHTFPSAPSRRTVFMIFQKGSRFSFRGFCFFFNV